MGARQSKRSVDITTTPKKGEGEVVTEGEGKLEKIGDADIKATTNGDLPHIEIVEKDENAKDEAAEKDATEEVKENGLSESEEAKTPDQPEETVNESAPVADKTPDSGNESKVEDTPETKKQKDKNKKKKWSFRSISFSKKDKQKPSKDGDKNGDVKEVAEENAEESATSPSIESPKSEEAKPAEAVSNGDASAEEIAKPSEATTAEEAPKVSEEATPAEPKAATVEEPKAPEPVVEKPAESAPTPAKEQEEPQPVEPPTPAVEETKEVRKEEVPPPLPSSNPPSPVTVFAESTKADALTDDQVPVVEPSVVTSIEYPPLAASSPVTKTVSAPVVEPLEEPVIEQVPETTVISSDNCLPKQTETQETEKEIKEPDSVPSPVEILEESKGHESVVEVPPKSPEEREPHKYNPPSVERTSGHSGRIEIKVSIRDNVTKEVSEPSIPTELIQAAPEQKSNESLPEVASDISVKEIPSDTIVENILEPTRVASEDCTEVSESVEQKLLEPIELTSVSAETIHSFDSPKESSENVEETEPSPAPVEQPASLPDPPASPTAVPESLPDVGSLPEVDASLPEVDASLPEVDASLPDVGDSLPDVGDSLPDVGDSLPDVGDSLPDVGDSLPDLSTESLPSLPEPVSDLEPMSLPPVESAPEPIAADCSAGELAPPTGSPVLTNGNANGLPSPMEEVTAMPSIEGPLKQVHAELTSEVRQEEGEKKNETAVEAAAVEE